MRDYLRDISLYTTDMLIQDVIPLDTPVLMQDDPRWSLRILGVDPKQTWGILRNCSIIRVTSLNVTHGRAYGCFLVVVLQD